MECCENKYNMNFQPKNIISEQLEKAVSTCKQSVTQTECCTIKQENRSLLKDDLKSLSSEQSRVPRSSLECEIKPFGCKFCTYRTATFDSNNDLVQHMEIMHSSQIKCFKCQKQLNPLLTEECKTSSCGCKYICKDCSLENCPEIFLNSVSDTKPMILHRKIQPPQCVCNICNNMYPREEIKSHLLKFHSNKKHIKCNKCLKVFTKQTHLLRHMLLLHSGYHKVMCLDCSMDFRNCWSFQNHCLAHEIKQPYVCIVCEFGFISEFSLQHHIKVKHQLASVKKLECRLCKKVWPSYDELVNHVVKIHGSAVKCMVCGNDAQLVIKSDPEPTHYSFPQQSLYRNITVKEYTCFICKNNFTETQKLVNHLINMHTDKSSKKCLDCNMVFSSISNHMKSKHSDAGQYECLSCGKMFYSNKNIRRHVSSCHNKYSLKSSLFRHVTQLEYTCYICKNTFRETQTLFQHLLNIHSDKSSNKCLECEIVFSNLSGHLKSKHSNGFQYECLNCGKFFYSSSHKKRHVSACHGKSSPTLDSSFRHVTLAEYTCFICKNNFTENQQLLNHLINIHSDKSSNKCLDCQIVCSNLSDHLKTKHSNGYQIECLKCSKVFHSNSNINRHVSTCYAKPPHKLNPEPRNSKFTLDPKSLTSSYRHVTLAEYTCYICKNTFTETKLLVKHLINTHSDKSSKKCVGCQIVFTNAKQVPCHMLYMHSDGDNTECLICGKICNGKPQARNHVLDCHYKFIINESVMKEDEHPFKCTNCPAMYFKSNKSLTKHFKNKHAEKKYICDVCNASFGSKEYLRTHLSGHGNAVECQKCGKKYKTEVLCKVHSKICGTGKMHVCNICGKNFKKINSMKRHMDNHSGDNLYKCDICQKQCVTQFALECHMSLHSDEKPHKCLECGKSYTAPGSLARHMLNHSGDRPHKCTICDSSFTQAVILINHMRIHNDERNHQCNLCGQRFRTKYVLTMHMKRHK